LITILIIIESDIIISLRLVKILRYFKNKTLRTKTLKITRVEIANIITIIYLIIITIAILAA